LIIFWFLTIFTKLLSHNQTQNFPTWECDVNGHLEGEKKDEKLTLFFTFNCQCLSHQVQRSDNWMKARGRDNNNMSIRWDCNLRAHTCVHTHISWCSTKRRRQRSKQEYLTWKWPFMFLMMTMVRPLLWCTFSRWKLIRATEAHLTRKTFFWYYSRILQWNLNFCTYLIF
jgi:hypothetical protein